MVAPEGATSKWTAGHALARCVHCSTWTVVEYGGGGYGPCPHAHAIPPKYSANELYIKYLEAEAREASRRDS